MLNKTSVSSWRGWAVALAALISAGAAGWLYLGEQPGPAGLLRPDDAGLVAEGAAVYKENCAACHGDNLQGEDNWRSRKPDGRMRAPPHDQSGHTWHHDDKLLFNLTKFGLAKTAGLKDYETDMPAYDGVLSDRQITAVLSFIKSRWPAEIRAHHDTLNQQPK